MSDRERVMQLGRDVFRSWLALLALVACQVLGAFIGAFWLWLIKSVDGPEVLGIVLFAQCALGGIILGFWAALKIRNPFNDFRKK